MEDEKLIAGNGRAAEFLTNHGFPVSKSTFAKWSAPSSGIDTAVEGYWGQLPLRRPSRLLDFARSRLRPAPTALPAPTAALPAELVTNESAG